MANKSNDQILKREAIVEIFKCGKNVEYFIDNYCKIRHPVRGIVPFKLYDYQRNALKAFLGSDRVIVNKARQLGFSTLMAAFIVWLTLFHKDKVVLIIANKLDVAKNTIKNIKLILRNLPSWIYLADIVQSNVHSVVFSNGSSIKSVARSDDAGRSEAVSLLVLDEAAHIERMDELWKGAGSTIATGGKVIAVSTPAGRSGWFYDIFSKAESGELSDWTPFITHWWENPDYAEGIEESPETPGGFTSPWFRKATAGWTRSQIAQELLTSFIESGETFFDANTLEHFIKHSIEPLDKTGLDKNLWIWKSPRPNFKYLISADVALGSGEDYSACHVIELQDLEVVAEYKGKMPPDVFGEFLIDLGTKYNNAYICPEGGSQGQVGQVTCFTIKNLGYRNLCYFDKESGRLIDQWTAEYKGIAPGFAVTLANRSPILAKLEEFMRKGYVKSYSKRIINEMASFIVKNSKAQAEKNANDDLIMALAIGVWVRDVCPEFRSANAASDMIAMYKAIQKNATTYGGSSSKRNELAAHKDRIRKMLQHQADPTFRPANSYGSFIFRK